MNFAQRLMKDSTDSAKRKLYEKQSEHSWHNCNTRQDTCWRFQCPSTKFNYVWKKWGIYFGVPKHQCYSKNNYCQYGCPQSWSENSLGFLNMNAFLPTFVNMHVLNQNGCGQQTVLYEDPLEPQ